MKIIILIVLYSTYSFSDIGNVCGSTFSNLFVNKEVSYYEKSDSNLYYCNEMGSWNKTDRSYIDKVYSDNINSFKKISNEYALIQDTIFYKQFATNLNITDNNDLLKSTIILKDFSVIKNKKPLSNSTKSFLKKTNIHNLCKSELNKQIIIKNYSNDIPGYPLIVSTCKNRLTIELFNIFNLHNYSSYLSYFSEAKVVFIKTVRLYDIKNINVIKNIESLDIHVSEKCDISFKPIIKLKNIKKLKIRLNTLGFSSQHKIANSTSAIKNLCDLKKLNTLNSLDLSKNSINDIFCLKDLKNLKELNLSHNNINDIYYLNKLENLETLDLSYNNIDDISKLNLLKKLKKLKINKNKLNKCSPKNLKELKSGISCYEKDGTLKSWWKRLLGL